MPVPRLLRKSRGSGAVAEVEPSGGRTPAPPAVDRIASRENDWIRPLSASRPPLTRLVEHEIIGPDVVAVLRPQPTGNGVELEGAVDRAGPTRSSGRFRLRHLIHLGTGAPSRPTPPEVDRSRSSALHISSPDQPTQPRRRDSSSPLPCPTLWTEVAITLFLLIRRSDHIVRSAINHRRPKWSQDRYQQPHPNSGCRYIGGGRSGRSAVALRAWA